MDWDFFRNDLVFWGILGLCLCFGLAGVIVFFQERHKKRLWRRNVGSDVVPGPLRISQAAYDKARQTVRADPSITGPRRALLQKICNMQDYSDFQPTEVATRWMLAYNFQADIDHYPHSLHLEQIEIGLSDDSKAEEYQKSLIKDRNFSGNTKAELLKEMAKAWIDSSYLGPFKAELRSLLRRINHPQASEFVIYLCMTMKKYEIATERLVKSDQVKQ